MMGLRPKGLTSKGLALAILAAFAGLAFHFAEAQSIWTDETTQLSGLALPFKLQLAWLTGVENPIPGVPPDRMPPLSYWIGTLWAGLFGLSEISLRVMGILATLAAAPALWLSARRLAGPEGGDLSALLVLALVYLSPGLITEAVEIRAYPLFFTFACWSVWAYLRAFDRPDSVRLLLLAVFCLLTIYTHFFGLVMAGLLWLTLLLVRIRRGQAAAVFAGGLATLALSAGLYPFVRAAFALSNGGQSAASVPGVLRDTARLGFRLLFHGSHMASLPLLGLAIVAGAGLAAIALRNRRPDALWVFAPMVLAFLILPALKLVVSGFDLLAPHYNLWLVPTFLLFLTSAVTGTRPILALVLGVILVLANLRADALLMAQPGLFSHGPGDWVADAISDPTTTVVIHDGAADWPPAYFALYYRTGGRLAQVLRQPGLPDLRLLPGQDPAPTVKGFTASFPHAVFLRTVLLSSSDLAAIAWHKDDCGILPMLQNLPAQSRCAFYGATMQIVLQGE